MNDLFNLFDVRVATVDVVTYSGNGGEEGMVGSGIVSEWDGMSCVAEWWWCLNGGIRTWSCWCGQWYVFLVGVVKFTGGGLVQVWEADAGDVGGSIFTDSEESCNMLLDSSVLLRCAY